MNQWGTLLVGILVGAIVVLFGTIAYLNFQPQPMTIVDGCPAPSSVNLVSAFQLGFSWKEQEKVVGGKLDPEVVGKGLPQEFVTEEGRNFAACLYSKRHPEATSQESLCYSMFLASAADPSKLEPFKRECFSVPRVSHVGKLENIVFNMVQSPTTEQVTLKLSPNLRTFWVSQDLNAGGFGQLIQKICSLPESSCLKCVQDGEATAISLKPGASLVSAGPDFPADAKACGS